jgi:hypothetical protein
MHYKNGREAKNGDKVVLISQYVGGAVVVGVLYDAISGNDYCNGKIAPIAPNDSCPNLNECLHLDDVLAALPAFVPDTTIATEPKPEDHAPPIGAGSNPPPPTTNA